MTLFAAGGLFFNEWYWEPIFRALVALPLIGIVAFVTALAVRRWLPSPGHRVWVAVRIIVGGRALVLGGACSWRPDSCPRPRSGRPVRAARGTLVSVWATAVTEAEVLAYFDALRPVAPGELKFKRG